MNDNAIVFALANPDPEVDPLEAGRTAAVVATGRSDFPNQINNVLAFPGFFRGMLDAGAREITQEVMLAAARAIAGCVEQAELNSSYIVPSVFDPAVAPAVAHAVRDAATRQGNAPRRPTSRSTTRSRRHRPRYQPRHHGRSDQCPLSPRNPRRGDRPARRGTGRRSSPRTPWSSSPRCSASSSRDATSCWPPGGPVATRCPGPAGSTSSRRPRRSATATGGSRQRPPTSSTGAWR